MRSSAESDKKQETISGLSQWKCVTPDFLVDKTQASLSPLKQSNSNWLVSPQSQANAVCHTELGPCEKTEIVIWFAMN